jgi:hypothetical protein
MNKTRCWLGVALFAGIALSYALGQQQLQVGQCYNQQWQNVGFQMQESKICVAQQPPCPLNQCIPVANANLSFFWQRNVPVGQCQMVMDSKTCKFCAQPNKLLCCLGLVYPNQNCGGQGTLATVNCQNCCTP